MLIDNVSTKPNLILNNIAVINRELRACHHGCNTNNVMNVISPSNVHSIAKKCFKFNRSVRQLKQRDAVP